MRRRTIKVEVSIASLRPTPCTPSLLASLISHRSQPHQEPGVAAGGSCQCVSQLLSGWLALLRLRAAAGSGTCLPGRPAHTHTHTHKYSNLLKGPGWRSVTAATTTQNCWRRFAEGFEMWAHKTYLRNITHSYNPAQLVSPHTHTLCSGADPHASCRLHWARNYRSANS